MNPLCARGDCARQFCFQFRRRSLQSHCEKTLLTLRFNEIINVGDFIERREFFTTSSFIFQLTLLLYLTT